MSALRPTRSQLPGQVAPSWSSRPTKPWCPFCTDDSGRVGAGGGWGPTRTFIGVQHRHFILIFENLRLIRLEKTVFPTQPSAPSSLLSAKALQRASFKNESITAPPLPTPSEVPACSEAKDLSGMLLPCFSGGASQQHQTACTFFCMKQLPVFEGPVLSAVQVSAFLPSSPPGGDRPLPSCRVPFVTRLFRPPSPVRPESSGPGV